MQNHRMVARYEIRQEFDGWTVYDTLTDHAAVVNDALQICLTLEDADDLADVLNHLHVQQSNATAH